MRNQHLLIPLLTGCIFTTQLQAMGRSPDVSVVPVSDGMPAISPTSVSAPEGAPNILLVLLDDVGFAAASTFGGAVDTPNYEALADQGLRYNRFHTTALCSPTRAALLTGRNHHRVGMGSITNLAFGEPGYTSIIPDSAATIADVLKLNGYNTAWFGKNHLTPEWEVTSNGPYDRWPTGLGFDYFYGFMDGATDQFAPVLVENTTAIDPPDDPDYILDKDLANHAIDWIHQQQSRTPDKPFFIYLAPGTAHVPLQAPADWIAKFKGQFDQGWDVLREQNFERQKALGVIPADTVLTPRPASIPAWDSLSEDEKTVATRLMEVFAAQLAYFDSQFGRITDELKAMGEWDNTLVVYIDGDNGADGAGGLEGNMIESLNGGHASTQYMLEHLDEMGGPHTFNAYPVGWAWANSSPFQYTKQIASHLGGTRDGLVISWPGNISQQTTLRQQFLHVTDIAPTIYEAVGITPPAEVEGVEQMSFDGSSFVASFTDANSNEQHDSQYFEIAANRAFYRDGWIASTTPQSLPWAPKPTDAPEDFDWELYNLDQDYSQSTDLAAQYPDKLTELRDGFEQAANENHVLPMNNQMRLRIQNSSLRPYITNGRDLFVYYPSDRRISNNEFPDIKNSAWSLELKLDTSGNNTNGTLITQGGYENGWGLFLFDAVPTFIYKSDSLPGNQWTLMADQPLPEGAHQLQLQVQPDSATAGAGATVTLYVDQDLAGQIHLDNTAPNDFINDGVGIGRDFITTLTNDYVLPFAFNGELGAITINLE